MKRFSSLIASTSLGMGIMLSPESLVALGRSAGALGSGILIAMLGAVLAHQGTISGYARGPGEETAQTGDAPVIGQAFGMVFTTAVILCCRVVFAVTLATALLATAGFVFNEVFLHWFPNFAFAAGLLGCLLVLNLSSESLARGLQVALVFTAVVLLITLSLVGLWGLPYGQVGAAGTPEAPVPWRHAAIPMMALIGFDLALFSGNGKQESSVPGRTAMAASLLGGALTLGLWVWVSTTAVAGARLAESTIPHMIAARAVGGDWARVLMGVVVLSGSAAAINALFVAVPRSVLGIMSTASGSPAPSLKKWGRISTLLILGLLIAGMLALGTAGEPAIDLLVRAGMLFWLVSYIIVHGAGLWLWLGNRSAPSKRARGAGFWKRVVTMAILGMSLIILMVSDPDRGALMAFMTLTSAASLLISWLAWGIVDRRAGLARKQ